VIDLVVTRWRLPWATATAAVLLYAARFTHALIPFTLHELGILRLVFAVGLPLVVLGIPGWWMARRPGRHARNRLAHAAAPQWVAAVGNTAAQPRPGESVSSGPYMHATSMH
jgi:hypothetical protein